MALVKLTGITSFSIDGEAIVADDKGVATISDAQLSSESFAHVRAALQDGQGIDLVPEQKASEPAPEQKAGKIKKGA